MRQHGRGKSYGNEQSLGNFCEDALKNSDSVLCSNIVESAIELQ